MDKLKRSDAGAMIKDWQGQDAQRQLAGTTDAYKAMTTLIGDGLQEIHDKSVELESDEMTRAIYALQRKFFKLFSSEVRRINLENCRKDLRKAVFTAMMALSDKDEVPPQITQYEHVLNGSDEQLCEAASSIAGQCVANSIDTAGIDEAIIRFTESQAKQKI